MTDIPLKPVEFRGFLKRIFLDLTVDAVTDGGYSISCKKAKIPWTGSLWGLLATGATKFELKKIRMRIELFM